MLLFLRKLSYCTCGLGGGSLRLGWLFINPLVTLRLRWLAQTTSALGRWTVDEGRSPGIRGEAVAGCEFAADSTASAPPQAAAATPTEGVQAAAAAKSRRGAELGGT